MYLKNCGKNMLKRHQIKKYLYCATFFSMMVVFQGVLSLHFLGEVDLPPTKILFFAILSYLFIKISFKK